MSISRLLVAGTLVGALALAGCSAGAEDPEEEATPAPTDAAPAAPEADLDGLPDIVAVVNDEEITLEDFTSAYEPQLQQASIMQQQSGQEVDQDELKVQVADMLVNSALLTQAATASGIEATDEDVDGVLKDLATQNGLESVDDVIAAFDEQGIAEEDVREDAADQVRIDAYVAAETNVEAPSDEELREQYDQMVEQSKQQGGEGEIPKFDEVKQQLADQAVSQEQNAAVEKIVTKLREDGNVDIKL